MEGGGGRDEVGRCEEGGGGRGGTQKSRKTSRKQRKITRCVANRPARERERERERESRVGKHFSVSSARHLSVFCASSLAARAAQLKQGGNRST